MVNVDNVNLYIITHGRPNPDQRPTTAFLEASCMPYYFTMNEKQVQSYIDAGVPPEKIVVSTDEFEEKWFAENKTFDVDFHGAICNREMCNIHARQQGVKYAVQFDDNIIKLCIGRNSTGKWNFDHFCKAYFPEMIRTMRDICESTNIGLMGMTLGEAVPTCETSILRVGYAYSFFMENVEAHIPWRGPFDDDVLHNLDFNHSGAYTNALIGAYGYAKETKSKTGMRTMYEKHVAIRPIGTANLYPDHVGVGIKSKANGRGRRVYHQFKKPMHQNIRVTDADKFRKTLDDIRQLTVNWREYCNGKNRPSKN